MCDNLQAAVEDGRLPSQAAAAKAPDSRVMAKWLSELSMRMQEWWQTDAGRTVDFIFTCCNGEWEAALQEEATLVDEALRPVCLLEAFKRIATSESSSSFGKIQWWPSILAPGNNST